MLEIFKAQLFMTKRLFRCLTSSVKALM